MIDKFMTECALCGRQCKNRRSLGNHLARSHKMTMRAYALIHIYENRVPLCECGCLRDVSWHVTSYCFNKFIVGHNKKNMHLSTNILHEEEKPNTLSHEPIRVQRCQTTVNDQLYSPAYVALHPPTLPVLEKPTTANVDVLDNIASSATKGSRQSDRYTGARIVVQPTSQFSKRACEQNTLASSDSILRILQATFGANNVIEKNGCDAYIETIACTISIDDPAAHALDNTIDLALEQIRQIALDISANLMMRDNNTRFIRLRSDISLCSLNATFESLVDHAYHASDGSLVLIDGTFKLSNDDHQIMTRESVIRTNEQEIFDDAPGREYTESTLLPAIFDLFRAHVAYWGWFYPSNDKTVSDALDAVKRAGKNKLNELSLAGSAGCSFLKNNFRSYWNVNKGPRQSFDDDLALERVLRYRLGLNTSIPYTYSLSDGSSISCRETFDITIKNVRYGFVVQRSAVSFFKPAAARDIWYELLGDNAAGATVWDPSAGFGGRMLGFAAVTRNGTYLGHDPATETWNDLCALAGMLESILPEFKTSITMAGSETFLPEPNSLDAVFTSPPYFAREQYFDEPGQCWRDHPTLDLWTENYLAPTLWAACNGLKSGRFCAINVFDELADIVKKIGARVGFRLAGEHRIMLNRDHFSKKYGHSKPRSEPLIVFEKP